jgi:hypothetical protein
MGATFTELVHLRGQLLIVQTFGDRSRFVQSATSFVWTGLEFMTNSYVKSILAPRRFLWLSTYPIERRTACLAM